MKEFLNILNLRYDILWTVSERTTHQYKSDHTTGRLMSLEYNPWESWATIKDRWKKMRENNQAVTQGSLEDITTLSKALMLIMVSKWGSKAIDTTSTSGNDTKYGSAVDTQGEEPAEMWSRDAKAIDGEEHGERGSGVEGDSGEIKWWRQDLVSQFSLSLRFLSLCSWCFEYPPSASVSFPSFSVISTPLRITITSLNSNWSNCAS